MCIRTYINTMESQADSIKATTWTPKLRTYWLLQASRWLLYRGEKQCTCSTGILVNDDYLVQTGNYPARIFRDSGLYTHTHYA